MTQQNKDILMTLFSHQPKKKKIKKVPIIRRGKYLNEAQFNAYINQILPSQLKP